ncbi:hypothetical protein CYMTET_8998 [Cymbomonas tetramitiformis]|uniref:Uncharacterized protein n=1 Tax=Cymbomonas tetramitiformis TaxID=36881 RepID=A0AAE0GRY1_9CHLO|nr:hypothetical protein CYMTET_8998 [Cymbomonas tetramitiformis]
MFYGLLQTRNVNKRFKRLEEQLFNQQVHIEKLEEDVREAQTTTSQNAKTTISTKTRLLKQLKSKHHKNAKGARAALHDTTNVVTKVDADVPKGAKLCEEERKAVHGPDSTVLIGGCCEHKGDNISGQGLTAGFKISWSLRTKVELGLGEGYALTADEVGELGEHFKARALCQQDLEDLWVARGYADDHFKEELTSLEAQGLPKHTVLYFMSSVSSPVALPNKWQVGGATEVENVACGGLSLAVLASLALADVKPLPISNSELESLLGRFKQERRKKYNQKPRVAEVQVQSRALGFYHDEGAMGTLTPDVLRYAMQERRRRQPEETRKVVVAKHTEEVFEALQEQIDTVQRRQQHRQELVDRYTTLIACNSDARGRGHPSSWSFQVLWRVPTPRTS